MTAIDLAENTLREVDVAAYGESAPAPGLGFDVGRCGRPASVSRCNLRRHAVVTTRFGDKQIRNGGC